MLPNWNNCDILYIGGKTMNNKDFNNYLAKRLLQARTSKKLTQNDVAKKIDVANNSTIGRYENGDRQPNLYNFYQMMLLYNTDANYYFPLEDKHNNSIPIFAIKPTNTSKKRVGSTKSKCIHIKYRCKIRTSNNRGYVYNVVCR